MVYSLRLFLLVVAVGSCFAAEESISSGFRVVYSVYRQCEDSQDPVTCLKARAVKLVDRAIATDAIPVVDGRGKRKRILPLLLLGLMMKGSMIALALKGLAILAGKALIISKLALVLAGVIALKKLFSGGHEKTTYEIVKQPIVSHAHEYTSSHEGGGYEHGSYGRSFDVDAHRMAYKAFAPSR